MHSVPHLERPSVSSQPLPRPVHTCDEHGVGSGQYYRILAIIIIHRGTVPCVPAQGRVHFCAHKRT